jgi:hypothetical protein
VKILLARPTLNRNKVICEAFSKYYPFNYPLDMIPLAKTLAKYYRVRLAWVKELPRQANLSTIRTIKVIGPSDNAQNYCSYLVRCINKLDTDLINKAKLNRKILHNYRRSKLKRLRPKATKIVLKQYRKKWLARKIKYVKFKTRKEPYLRSFIEDKHWLAFQLRVLNINFKPRSKSLKLRVNHFIN